MRAHRGHAAVGPLSGMLALALVAGVMLSAGAAGAAVLHEQVTFAAPQIDERDGYHHVTMPGTWTLGAPGEPALPKAGVQLLLPPGEEIVSVNVIPGERITLAGDYRVAPGQRQYPLGFSGPFEKDLPSAAIYASAAPFPERLHAEPHSGLLRGYRIVSLPLHPVEYRPAAGELSYYRSLEVEITTAPSATARVRTETMIRHDSRTLARLARFVDNPAATDAYQAVSKTPGLSRSLDPSLAYTYLIVTGDAWAADLTTLADFETQRGHKAGIFTKSWILSNYTAGSDDAENIRAFILDAYNTWDVDYVLLVGDADGTDGIPHRGLYAVAYGLPDDDIAGDLYYGCLDGTWNDDGDSYWGEAGEADLYFEIGVGRAPIDSQTELQNFITKATRYQSEPIVGECAEALMAGELLWDDPTWGGDYKDEIKDGASTHGYTTAGFPATMNVGTLYDRDYTWAESELLSLMENGLNIVNHLGHCNVNYALKMTNDDIPSFDNDGTVHSYNFVYSQGCYCGSFDNRDASGYYGDDCFGEQFVADDDGAAAVIMNSRYGWGEHMSTNGSSQYFDRQFFDAMFGEGIYALADANDDSKMDNIWALDYGANRWCYYQLNVFGDPAMHLWTAEPENLTADYPAVVFVGAPEMTINVSSGRMPVEGARVTIYTDDLAIYDTGVSNGFGDVTLAPNATVTGTLHVVVVAHDCLPHSGEAAITLPDGPYVIFDAHVVHDDAGDQDGEGDAGEAIGLDVMLENVGIETATNVSATITTTDPYVAITVPTRGYPDIPASGTAGPLVVFELELAGDTPDEHVVSFTVTADADEGAWESTFSLPVSAPVLAAGAVLLTDAPPLGDGDAGADAGETLRLQIWLLNSGHSDAPGLMATLSCADPHTVINDGSAECAGVVIGEVGLLSTFEVEVLSSCPEPATLVFDVDLGAANGFAAGLQFTVDVGGWFDDAEGDRGWSLSAAGDDATTGLWIRAEPIGTSDAGEQIQPEYDHSANPGELCFVTGNATAGSSIGTNDVDNGKTTLSTPVFDLSDALSATIEYWRWYTNDLGNNPGTDWWNVDITDNGTDWVSLEHTMDSGNLWTHFSLNVGDYVDLSDHVQMRFIAEDASPGSLVEAAVDDFLLNAVRSLPSGLSIDDVRQGYGIVSYGPNPFGHQASLVYRLAQATAVDLALYDVSGRKLRTLQRGTVEGGSHTLSFDGRDDGGRSLPSGIYFLRLETPEILEVRQVTILR
ncbi:MAG: T9SS type A sorting domain-containing protein [Candidatus Eisenbacteria sp.]|nr:T9SS type A sorting domain-containing protein [Candidatus Eisenbacteria bacterium]